MIACATLSAPRPYYTLRTLRTCYIIKPKPRKTGSLSLLTGRPVLLQSLGDYQTVHSRTLKLMTHKHTPDTTCETADRPTFALGGVGVLCEQHLLHVPMVVPHRANQATTGATGFSSGYFEIPAVLRAARRAQRTTTTRMKTCYPARDHVNETPHVTHQMSAQITSHNTPQMPNVVTRSPDPRSQNGAGGSPESRPTVTKMSAQITSHNYPKSRPGDV